MTGLKLARDLTLPLELATEPLGILANRGRGKSYAAHVLVEELSDAGVPVVILDVKGDWWGVRSNAAGTGDGLPFYIFGGDHADVPLEPEAGELLADLIVDERVSAVLDLTGMSKTKARTFSTTFAERLYRRNRLPVFLVVDEADVLVPQRQSAETARLIGAMEDLAKRGRGRGIGMAIVTQRPQEVAKSVLDLVETLLLLGMTGPRALKAVRDWTSIHVDEEAPDDVMRALPKMQTGECYVWSPVHDVLKRIRVRKLRTFDSHPTPKVGEAARTPRKWRELDLAALGERIASTVERAEANDPRKLRAQLEQERKRAADLERHAARVEEYAGRLEQQLAERPAEPERVEVPVLSDDDWAELRQFSAALSSVATGITEAIDRDRAARTAPATPAPRPAPVRVADPTPKRAALEAYGSSGTTDDDLPELRKGARRMVEALGRMHPQQLTRTQWATAARMKATGGTWSTYVGDIRKRGLLEEHADGTYSLTAAGYDYIGGVPEPLTAAELQAYFHTPGVLREGGRRLLDVIMEAYPGELSRDECAERADLSNGGTLSTYLGELVKHGIVEMLGKGGPYRATDLLMYGAQLPQ